jgi:hypothetical protein
MKKTLILLVVNLFLVVLLLQVAGLTISYCLYVQARNRYVLNQEGHSDVLFNKFFSQWNLRVRPIPQYLTVKDDQVTYYWNMPGIFRMRTFERDYQVNTDVDGIRRFNRKRTDAGFPVLVMGDSHSWGFGVDDDETYTALLNRTPGLDFTSISCSSYGTVREFLKAQQLIRQKSVERPRAIVIQYCPNDKAENESFVENGFHYRAGIYKIPDRQIYSWSSAYHSLSEILRPAEWPSDLMEILMKSTHADIPLLRIGDPAPLEDAFSLVCGHFLRQPEFSDVKKFVIILAMSPKFASRKEFEAQERVVGACAEYLKKNIGKDARFVSQGDYDSIARQYFEVDDHLNTLGHARFAAIIRQSINQGSE